MEPNDPPSASLAVTYKKKRYCLNIPILSMKSALKWSKYMSVASFSITLTQLLHQRYRGAGAIDKAKT